MRKTNEPLNYGFLTTGSSQIGEYRRWMGCQVENLDPDLMHLIGKHTGFHWAQSFLPFVFGVLFMCRRGLSHELPRLLQCLNKPSALRAFRRGELFAGYKSPRH